MYDISEGKGAAQMQVESLRGLAGASTGPFIAPPPNGRSEIARELENQEKALCGLLQLIETLQQKLEPVLLPAQPDTNCGKDSEAIGSQIAGCIASNTNRVQNAAALVKNVLDRLAV